MAIRATRCPPRGSSAPTARRRRRPWGWKRGRYGPGLRGHQVRDAKQRVDELYEKVDAVVEGEAENRTDIVWLKRAVRGLVIASLGGGAVLFGSPGL